MKRRKIYSGIKYVFLAGLACLYLVPVAMMLLGSDVYKRQVYLSGLEGLNQFRFFFHTTV